MPYHVLIYKEIDKCLIKLPDKKIECMCMCVQYSLCLLFSGQLLVVLVHLYSLLSPQFCHSLFILLCYIGQFQELQVPGCISNLFSFKLSLKAATTKKAWSGTSQLHIWIVALKQWLQVWKIISYYVNFVCSSQAPQLPPTETEKTEMFLDFRDAVCIYGSDNI